MSFLELGTVCAIIGGEDDGRLVVTISEGAIRYMIGRVVISEGYWAKTFDGGPSADGKKLRSLVGGPIDEYVFDRNRLREIGCTIPGSIQ